MLQTYEESARTVMERCDLLATFSEEPSRLTRRFATAPMHEVHEEIKGWLLGVGITAEIDAMSTIIGRREASVPGAQTLLIGSHLDTVRNAGKYDGILGVLIGLACLERLYERGENLPFALELLGTPDEEGSRYPCTYMGSRVLTGRFEAREIALLDTYGVAVAEALRAFGCNASIKTLTTPRWQREALLGYCEVHIEQGPVLETRDLPLAVVTSIVGQQVMHFQFSGVQGHAGTLPMDLRHDALCAAAEFVVAVETLARSVPGLVATVGQFQIQPGSSNVVPNRVELSLDIRHEDDALRTRCASQLATQAAQICTRRGITLTHRDVQRSSTVTCAPNLRRRWEEALAIEGYPVFSLPSGAGHDGVAISALADISMLFVRCQGGISHNPAESVQEADVAAAIAVLERFVLLTAQEVQHGSV